MDSVVGEIRMIASSYAPEGWHFCDGSLLSTTQHPVLFSVLGTTYGGDGATTFALPDLRGRVPIGAGQAPGLSSYSLGVKAGSETVTLTEAQVPSHSHALMGTSATADAATPGPDKMLATGDPTVRPYNDAALATGGFGQFNPASIGPTGPAQSHENRMSSVGIHFIIAGEGISLTN
jgi:microcystin-dependent protein